MFIQCIISFVAVVLFARNISNSKNNSETNGHKNVFTLRHTEIKTQLVLQSFSLFYYVYQFLNIIK